MYEIIRIGDDCLLVMSRTRTVLWRCSAQELDRMILCNEAPLGMALSGNLLLAYRTYQQGDSDDRDCVPR